MSNIFPDKTHSTPSCSIHSLGGDKFSSTKLTSKPIDFNRRLPPLSRCLSRQCHSERDLGSSARLLLDSRKLHPRHHKPACYNLFCWNQHPPWPRSNNPLRPWSIRGRNGPPLNPSPFFVISSLPWRPRRLPGQISALG